MDSISYGKKLSALLQLDEIDYKQYYILRTENDTFLESTPQLNHLVPAVLKDGNWQIVTEPDYFDHYNSSKFLIPNEGIFNDYFDDEQDYEDWKRDCSEYEIALQCVIFDGWGIQKVNENNFLIYKEHESIYFFDTGEISFCKGLIVDNIQSYFDLTKYNLPLNEKGGEKFKL